MHKTIVNGKYRAFHAQLLVETLQARHDQFAFLLHPAILKALYGWDFATRGLTVMHFVSVTLQERRTSSRTLNMCDFSSMSRLPVARTSSVLDSILEALDGL